VRCRGKIKSCTNMPPMAFDQVLRFFTIKALGLPVLFFHLIVVFFILGFGRSHPPKQIMMDLTKKWINDFETHTDLLISCNTIL